DMVANVPLLRHRVLKLLKRSTNYTHQYNNLILGAGYQQPNKTQRRFFTARVVEMIEEGLIDKIAVPTTRGAAVCVQLTQTGAEYLEKGDLRQVDFEENDYMLLAPVEEEEYVWTGPEEDNVPNRMVPLQRQIIGLLESSPNGMIIKDISQSLGFFDRRTIEQMLTRLCSRVPPRHIADLHPVTMLHDQNLSDERLDWIHMDNVGNFTDLDESIFWKDQDDIDKHINEYQVNKARKANSSPTKPRKKVYKNVGPDGLPKRGRPRKAESEKAKKPRKYSSTNPPNEPKKPPTKRKSKTQILKEGTLAEEIDELESDDDEDADSTVEELMFRWKLPDAAKLKKPERLPNANGAEVPLPAVTTKEPATAAESEDSQRLSTPLLADDAPSKEQAAQDKGEGESKKRDRPIPEEPSESRPSKRRKVTERSLGPQAGPMNEGNYRLI
ncbi:11494_t:CDS:2, partial [Acaulospora colombiana]